MQLFAHVLPIVTTLALLAMMLFAIVRFEIRHYQSRRELDKQMRELKHKCSSGELPRVTFGKMKTQGRDAMKTLVFLLMLSVVGLTSYANAQDAGAIVAPAVEVLPELPGAPLDVGDAASSIITNIQGGNWKMVVAAVLSLLMFAAHKFKVRTLSIFSGDRGGIVLLFLMSAAGAWATVLMVPGVKVTVDLALSTVGVALTAAGGWNVLKRLIWPQE